MLSRWISYFERFNYVIVHKYGISNKVADALSRHTILLVTIFSEIQCFQQLKESYVDDEDLEIFGPST